MDHFERLSHSVYHCKYHVIWIPKYRRKELYGNRRTVVIQAIKKWAGIKGVGIVEGHACPDHIHLCLSIPPQYAVSNIIGLLKGKSASEVMSFGRKSVRMARGRRFWARGYCVSTVGLDEETIREYIRNQEENDRQQEELGFEQIRFVFSPLGGMSEHESPLPGGHVHATSLLVVLTRATQAWVELEYNREINEETGQRPVDRLLCGPEISRKAPDSKSLRFAFTRRG